MNQEMNPAPVHAVVHTPRQVEILDPRGVVSYRRPLDDVAVFQALRTQGYAVRVPGCRDMRVLELLPCVDGRAHKVVFDSDGLTVYSDVV